RDGGVGFAVLVQQRLEELGGEKGSGAVEDEDVPVETGERGGGRSYGVAGALRLLLNGKGGPCGQGPVELVLRPRRADDDERVGAERQDRCDRPIEQPPPEERVQMLGAVGAHARSESCSHHDRGERRGHGFEVLAGGGGFEPPVTGPKPAALPLGYA